MKILTASILAIIGGAVALILSGESWIVAILSAIVIFPLIMVMTSIYDLFDFSESSSNEQNPKSKTSRQDKLSMLAGLLFFSAFILFFVYLIK